jgi:hypothetical protein
MRPHHLLSVPPAFCFDCVFSTKGNCSVHARFLTCAVTAKVGAHLITPAFRERLWPFPGGIARQIAMKALVA